MDKVDAAVGWPGGLARIFAGGLIFEMEFATKTISTPPTPMNVRWPSLPDGWNLPDAAMLSSDSKTMFLIKGQQCVVIETASDTIISAAIPLSEAINSPPIPAEITQITCAIYYGSGYRVYDQEGRSWVWNNVANPNAWMGPFTNAQHYPLPAPYNAICVDNSFIEVLAFKGGQYLQTTIYDIVENNAAGPVYEIADNANGITGLPVGTPSQHVPRNGLKTNKPLLDAVSSAIKSLHSNKTDSNQIMKISHLVKTGNLQDPLIAEFGRKMVSSGPVHDMLRSASEAEPGIRAWVIGAEVDASLIFGVSYFQGIIFDINPAPGHHGGLRRYRGFGWVGGHIGISADVVGFPITGGVSWADTFNYTGWFYYETFLGAAIVGLAFSMEDVLEPTKRVLTGGPIGGAGFSASHGYGYKWDLGGLYY